MSYPFKLFDEPKLQYLWQLIRLMNILGVVCNTTRGLVVNKLADYSKKMKKNKTVWVTWAESESGDHYGPFVFAKKPTDKKFEAFWRGEAPGDFDADCEGDTGPGKWGSWIYSSLEKQELIE